MVVDESTVGDTPLVALNVDCAPTVLGKVEWLHFPGIGHGGSSLKARIAVAMLDAAETTGHLPGATVLEASSGNTARALARVAGARGYDATVVVPDNIAAGKRGALEAAGATIHEVPAEAGYDALLARADELAAAGGYWRADQYRNPANPRAHERTGREIWRDTGGQVTGFVAGAGTGGTVTGVGRTLRQRDPTIEVVGFEPADATHSICGLKYLRGGGFHPDTYVESVLDRKRYVDTERARTAARDLAAAHAQTNPALIATGRHDPETIRRHLRVDGDFLVGPSSGAAIACIRRLASEGVFDREDTVVVPLCDRGDTYPEGDLWGDRL
ncbi:PLP-dependent cysteine synthase family protein [Halosegnis sp.]|uniref:PLP-dependent cysteine synthase family protein n=1 Tax=Halosegnis sp. TaxID=2864959 RepID=UPI0035D41268